MRGTYVRRAVVAGAVAAVVGGVSFGASAFAEGGTAAHNAPAQKAKPAAAKPAVKPGAEPGAQSAKDTAPEVVRQLIAKGTVDGQKWSVTQEFYATFPAGYEVPAPPPGLPGGTSDATSLLCQRMVVGGVRIDHQGGPWSDCQPVSGAHDPGASGEEGLWGLHDKGTTGARLFVANPAGDVAYGVVTLSDGTRLTARRVSVPTTDYGTWAVAIPDGRTIATVDAYDAHHHRVSHETDWR